MNKAISGHLNKAPLEDNYAPFSIKLYYHILAKFVFFSYFRPINKVCFKPYKNTN